MTFNQPADQPNTSSVSDLARRRRRARGSQLCNDRRWRAGVAMEEVVGGVVGECAPDVGAASAKRDGS